MTMKKRHTLFAGMLCIIPGLAFSASIETMANIPSADPDITLYGHPFYATHSVTDFASVEPAEISGPAPTPSASNTAARQRLAAWLLGPSIIAMATIARRRDPEITHD